MSELTSTLSNFFGGAGGKLLSAGATGTGAVGNLLNMIQQGQQYSKIKQFENMSPQQLAAKVAAGTAPLTGALTQSVGNAVQGADAERGLATSPGIFNADLAQSLAPYQQFNQSQALQLLMAKMGLPAEAKSILGPTAGMSNAFAQLFKQFQQPTSTVPSGPVDFQNLIWGNQPPSSGGLTDTPVFDTTGATA